jgi:heterogeneous nuclear ribonucleoprotein F/H
MQALPSQSGFTESFGLTGMTMSGRGVGGSGGGGRGGLHAPLHKRTGGGIQVGEHTGFLRMRGLPFSATRDDIYKFFIGYNPIQESVVLTYRNDGRATGEAYIGFATPDDSERAMELHRRSMGNRYIELFISNKDEQGRAMARFGNNIGNR